MLFWGTSYRCSFLSTSSQCLADLHDIECHFGALLTDIASGHFQIRVLLKPCISKVVSFCLINVKNLMHKAYTWLYFDQNKKSQVFELFYFRCLFAIALLYAWNMRYLTGNTYYKAREGLWCNCHPIPSLNRPKKGKPRSVADPRCWDSTTALIWR